jgi:hypothetical protein
MNIRTLCHEFRLDLSWFTVFAPYQPQHEKEVIAILHAARIITCHLPEKLKWNYLSNSERVESAHQATTNETTCFRLASGVPRVSCR